MSTIAIFSIIERRIAADRAIKHACALLAQHPDVLPGRRPAYKAAAAALPGLVRLIETAPPQIPNEVRGLAIGAFAALIPERVEAGEDQGTLLAELALL